MEVHRVIYIKPNAPADKYLATYRSLRKHKVAADDAGCPNGFSDADALV